MRGMIEFPASYYLLVGFKWILKSEFLLGIKIAEMFKIWGYENAEVWRI